MKNIYKILLVLLAMTLILAAGCAKMESGGTGTGSESGFVSKFGRGSKNTKGELNFPSGITVDTNGNVYVCEEWNNRISKFDREGNFLTMWGSTGCLGLDTDNDNNVYVVSITKHKVSKYDSNGVVIKEWGTLGSGDDQFNTPRDIAINKGLGLAYVLDSKNYRVQVFDLNGNYQNIQWGSYGNGDVQFGGSDGPYGIAVDQNSNNVYVADSGQTRIQKFDQSGNFLLKWGTKGKKEGEIRWDRGIDVDDNGNIYVADSDNERLQIFDSNGNFIRAILGLPPDPEFNPIYPLKQGCFSHLLHTDCTTYHNETDGPFHPRAVAVWVDTGTGDVFVFAAAAYAKRVDRFKYDSSGNFIDFKTWGWLEKDHGVFNTPKGMTLNSLNGDIYIADEGNSLIQRFDTNGGFKTSWGYFDRVFTQWNGGDGSFGFPTAITADNDGNVYVLRSIDVYYSGDPELRRIQKFDENGNFLSSWNYPDFNKGMMGMTYNPFNNYLYVSNTPEYKIQYFDLNGVFKGEFGGFGDADGKFGFPGVIGIDRNNGNVYVVDGSNQRIQKFSPDGEFLLKWGQNGTGEGEFKFGVYSGVYVDNNGDVYVADTGNSRIQVFDSEGNFILTWGSFSGADGKFIFPNSVVVDPKGYVYVLDTAKNNVQKFKPIPH